MMHTVPRTVPVSPLTFVMAAYAAWVLALSLSAWILALIGVQSVTLVAALSVIYGIAAATAAWAAYPGRD